MSNLAGAFKSVLATVQNSVGSTALVAGAAQASYLLQCDIACTGNTGVQVSITVTRNASTTYLVKKAPVPQGSTLQIIDGQKLVLQSGDVLSAICETEGESVDVVVSYVENVNLE